MKQRIPTLEEFSLNESKLVLQLRDESTKKDLKLKDLPPALVEEIQFIQGLGWKTREITVWQEYGRYFIGLGLSSNRIFAFVPIIERYKNTDANLGYSDYYKELHIDTLIRVSTGTYQGGTSNLM
ncbi:MAG: hypothetical protein WC979_01390 [Candidatus Pacearchaeota archaeon]|jgi:hypothetical protein|nr:hypothetical protein [Clostridia bacterium]